MKTLMFFRHAKTEQQRPGQSDFDRELTDVGHNAAHRMGREIGLKRPLPDLIFCSTARRTRQTLDFARTSWPASIEVQFREELYLAEPEVFLKLICGLPQHVTCIMFVGHNPGIAQAALMMACPPQDAAGEGLHRRLREQFPTSALAVLTQDGEPWSRTAWGKAQLQSCLRVKEL